MTRTVKKPDERRDEIIKAARELFHTKDYEKATMKDLMDQLNIAKGTIYHYFSSKQELLQAVIHDMIDNEFERLTSLMQSDRVKNLPALEKFQVLLTESNTEKENEQILESLHHPENAQMHTRQLGQYILKLAPLWAEVFTQGNSEGVFHVKKPLETAEFILAGAQFLTDMGFYPWSESQINRRMQALPAFLEAMLGAPEGSFSFLG